jgi:hypothetical protein
MKKTKKLIALALAALLLCMPLVIASCGDDDDVRLTFATGGTAGTYFPLGGEMASVINNNTSIQVTAVASNASADNIQQIGNGDAHIAIVQNDVMSYAFNGTEIWTENPPVTNMATLMSLYPETVQIIAAADSGINSIEDLVGKRVSIGDIGSGVEANALQVLGVHGITTDDIVVSNLGFSASADAMRDRRLDAVFITSGTPNAAVLELSTGRDLNIIPIAQDKINELLSKYAFYVQVAITSDEYSFLSQTVSTVAVQATLIASTSVSDQSAYNIVKALIENAGDISHARGAYIIAENAVKSISVDLHPGAARYFREIGVLN